ncbi:RimJ/RimL family protein N-acetyltransferase [Chryseobacterium ginsenosidimutans]|uniref:GNAT family N-acetyltransferase n=1 Tax=Chryseobacterium ginsenosidimutans TaxID=687846 RepID=UPI00216943D4|nr:GNAT family protein [Chryseobacterium ginsenosidimutans]MCS3869907.1 RimJ/RimL family protein N-acetyltransferase [Chryseobacterium ginsenosidimutans]
MQLFTERLLLRDITIEDKQAIFDYRSDSETNKFQSWIPETLEDVDRFIQRNNKEFNQPESWYQVLITDKETKAVIGDVGIHFFGSENLQVELGITLDKNFHGKGYASEALKGVINFLFNDLKKHRIMASVDPDNIDSLHLMERIGFRKEGHFVKSLFWKNNWVDDVIYALLQEDWIKK